MVEIIFWAIAYSLSTAFSIALLGSRELIGGNLLNAKVALALITSWQFIVAMILAIFSRFFFIMINNVTLKIPSLAPSATTITAFITVISFIFIIVINYYVLHERLTANQIVGTAIILVGIIVLLK